MKKTVSLVLVCALLVCSLLSLTSCGAMLTGKYQADLAIAKVTYEFEMFGKVTKTTDPFIGDTTTIEGEYKINDEGTKITFTFNDEAETYDFVTGNEGDVKYIKIDGIQFNVVE
jgi:hypothetical protein